MCDAYYIFRIVLKKVPQSFSVGQTMDGGLRTKSKYEGCSVDEGDGWHQFRSGNMSIMSFRFIL